MIWPFSWAYRKGYRAAFREPYVAPAPHEIECHLIGGEMDGKTVVVAHPAPKSFTIPKLGEGGFGQLVYERQRVYAEYR